MNTRTNILALAILLSTALTAQERYFTRDGEVKFHSETPVENIEAINEKASSVWDVGSNQIEFAVLMKAFQFEKALMLAPRSPEALYGLAQSLDQLALRDEAARSPVFATLKRDER